MTVIDRRSLSSGFSGMLQGYGQLWIAYKEAARNREAKFKVDRYYKSDWKPIDELNLTLEGLNLDQVYEIFSCRSLGIKLPKMRARSSRLPLIVPRK